MREITYAEALREALREEMRRDPSVFILGEEVGRYWGGTFAVTKGLAEEFGDERVRDTPISEAAIVGLGMGAAVAGMRPVSEIMFSDLTALAMDQVANQVAKLRYMSGGQAKVPLIIRAAQGGGVGMAAHHSQCLEAWFMHTPGLYVVTPSTPYDAKGLLKTALRGNNPVVFLEHKLLYLVKGPVPEEEYTIPFGRADVKRKGDDVTVVANSLMVQRSLRAAEELEKQGISVEVVDPRTLIPLDEETILGSVKKTARLVIVHEANRTAGWGAEIAARAAEKAIDYLDAPVVRVAAPDVPTPFSTPMEQYAIPDEKRIAQAVSDLLGK